MGSSLSTRVRRKVLPKESSQSGPSVAQVDFGQFEDGPDFLRPYQDPRALDDHESFPFDGHDISSASESQLFHAYNNAPLVHHYGHVKIARISKSLVIKGGLRVTKSELGNTKFAYEALRLPVPKVHRTFTAQIPDMLKSQDVEGYFIVMDYIAGSTVESCWDSLDDISKEFVVQQIASIIETMQSKTLNNLPVGPIGHDGTEKFEGPWFTDYGAGPFASLAELEAWCNHKIDVCAMVKQLPPGIPKFRFTDMVFTHQDVAPRNLILDANMKVWLIDWGCAGVYPRGFEQAVLRAQSRNAAFADMVLAKLSDKHDELTRQYAAIRYGLSTGWML